MKISHLLAFSFVATGIAFCSSGSDRNDRVARAYADILRYRDGHVRSDSSAVRAGIDSVLTSYGLTQGSYQQHFRALADDPASLRQFFQTVQDRLGQTSLIPPVPAQEPTTK